MHGLQCTIPAVELLEQSLHQVRELQPEATGQASDRSGTKHLAGTHQRTIQATQDLPPASCETNSQSLLQVGEVAVPAITNSEELNGDQRYQAELQTFLAPPFRL